MLTLETRQATLFRLHECEVLRSSGIHCSLTVYDMQAEEYGDDSVSTHCTLGPFRAMSRNKDAVIQIAQFCQR